MFAFPSCFPITANYHTLAVTLSDWFSLWKVMHAQVWSCSSQLNLTLGLALLCLVLIVDEWQDSPIQTSCLVNIKELCNLGLLKCVQHSLWKQRRRVAKKKKKNSLKGLKCWGYMSTYFLRLFFEWPWGLVPSLPLFIKDKLGWTGPHLYM